MLFGDLKVGQLFVLDGHPAAKPYVKRSNESVYAGWGSARLVSEIGHDVPDIAIPLGESVIVQERVELDNRIFLAPVGKFRDTLKFKDLKVGDLFTFMSDSPPETHYVKLSNNSTQRGYGKARPHEDGNGKYSGVSIIVNHDADVSFTEGGGKEALDPVKSFYEERTGRKYL